MRILDVCCGAEKIYQGWQKKLGDDFIKIDIRKGDFSYKTNAQVCPVKIIVKPTVIADMRYLPFKDGCFDNIVCDPPHLDCGLNAFMTKAYGSWDQQEVNYTMKLANNEIARVLKTNGSMVLKILRKDVERYVKLLKNFVFFLPIQTFRSNGCIETDAVKNGAIWLLGIKQESPVVVTQFISLPEIVETVGGKSLVDDKAISKT